MSATPRGQSVSSSPISMVLSENPVNPSTSAMFLDCSVVLAFINKHIVNHYL